MIGGLTRDEILALCRSALDQAAAEKSDLSFARVKQGQREIKVRVTLRREARLLRIELQDRTARD